MINQSWALIAIRNAFSGHVFVGLADATDIKIGRMVGYADRTSRETVVRALSWRRKISDAGFSSIDAFPGDNGEILVSGIEHNLEFEIIVEENQALTVTLSSDDTVLRDVACGSFNDADSVLKEAAVRV